MGSGLGGNPGTVAERALTDRLRKGIPCWADACFTLFMWTESARGRMARIERQTRRCPTDLTDKKWERIAPLYRGFAARGGRAGPACGRC
jgi:hypothetical protein